MRICLLSPVPERLLPAFGVGDIIYCLNCPPDELPEDWDILISYNYRHLIPKHILEKGRCINLHASYLPWNRGAHPNLWSWLDNTPKGVTIHYMDEKFDTGDILLQKEVEFNDEENTLSLTYQKLSNEIEKLFIQNWQSIKANVIIPTKQVGQGSYHRTSQCPTLPMGWDTPIKDLVHANP